MIVPNVFYCQIVSKSYFFVIFYRGQAELLSFAQPSLNLRSSFAEGSVGNNYKFWILNWGDGCDKCEIFWTSTIIKH